MQNRVWAQGGASRLAVVPGGRWSSCHTDSAPTYAERHGQIVHGREEQRWTEHQSASSSVLPHPTKSPLTVSACRVWCVQVNGVGLWLFSRQQQDPDNTELMLSLLEEVGLDTSELVAVEQEGCKYEGAP